ncbi:MAG TPA: NlpC/P60 family protein [Nocardioidaceae bacterium]|nr:NlpC/P60 family protein [Nocardioidaceae bacterium]
MRTARKTSVIRTTVAIGATLITGMVVLPQSGYASPDPSIQEVQRRADRLFHEAEQAQERLNTIRVELKDTRRGLKGLRSDVADQQRTLDATADRVSSMVAVQAQQSPMNLTTQLLASGNPDEFLAGLAAMESYNSTQASLLDGYQAAAAELDLRKQQLREQVDAIAEAKDQAAKEYDTVKEKSDAAQDLLDELEAEQLDTSRGDTRPPTGVEATSEQAQIAVDYALAQLGDPYVYGAAGPDSYDCSGLTMAAWGAAGVSLPHSSSVQATMGTSIPLSSAVPGDLLFYYSPVSHVGMYIGNGQIVHAPNSGSTVEIVPASGYMPLTDVRHIG